MTTDAFKEKLAQLNAEYRDALPAKFSEIDALWGRYPDAGALADLHRLLHTMAGSAKVFGCAALGGVAREAENALAPIVKEGGAPDAQFQQRFDALLQALRQAVI